MEGKIMVSSEILVKYDIKKKSMPLAYLFLFFLFCISAHRLYTGNIISALVQIGLEILSAILFCFMPVLGIIIWLIWVIWILLDLILTMKNVKSKNYQIARSLGINI
ncbi:hypothetical protein ACFX5K_01400 [Rickettsiales bacterium LUAb2]